MLISCLMLVRDIIKSRINQAREIIRNIIEVMKKNWAMVAVDTVNAISRNRQQTVTEMQKTDATKMTKE